MIRKMMESDLIKVVLLEEKVFGSSLGINFLHDELNINIFAHYYILEDDDKNIMGYIGYRCYDENCEILNFLLEPLHQSKGNGTLLLNNTLKELSSLNIKSISLEVRKSNTKAINFYIKNGFNLSHSRKDYYITEDALVYIKEV